MKILEAEILTADLAGTREFYLNTLGFRLSSSSTGGITITVGKSLLTFVETKALKPVYHFAFNIPNNRSHEAIHWIKPRAELIKATEEALIADFTNWNAKAFYFYDNNGNILEFLCRYDLSNDSDQPFSAESICEISEMAIVTDDVSTLAGKLCSEGIPVFPKQPLLKNFGALGDDEGLLILSEKERHWFPTEDLALPFPVKIKLQQGEKALDFEFNTPAANT